MITTKNQAQQFLTTFHFLHPLVHPEDDFTKVIDSTNTPAFNKNQVKFLNARFDEVYKLLDDPCLYILEVVRPQIFNNN